MRLLILITCLFVQPIFAHQIEIDLSKVTVRVIATSWCSTCKSLNEKLVEQGILPESEKTQPIVEGEFLYDVNEPIKMQQIIVDLEDFDPEGISPVFQPHPDFQYVPHIFIYYGDEIIYIGGIVSNQGHDFGYQEVLREKVKVAIDEYKNIMLSVLEYTPQLHPNSNILLVSTGTNPESIPLFNSQVIDELQDLFFKMGYPFERLTTLFGNGIHSIGMQTFTRYYDSGGYSVRTLVQGFDINIDEPSSLDSLVSTLNDLDREDQNILSIFVGHGNKEGAPLWMSSDLSPEQLKSAVTDKSNHVIISGTCYSGIFAQTASCGFFAARPSRPSSGCHEESQFDRDDYITKIMEALETDCQGEELCRSPFKGDLDGDRKISFAEAHWYASINGNLFDLPYTDLDAVTDQVLEQYSDEVPSHLTYEEFTDLIPFGSGVDQVVARKIGRTHLDLSTESIDLLDESEGLSSPSNRSLKDRIIAALIPNLSSLTNEFMSQEKINQMARRFFARKLIADKGLTEVSQTWNEIERCENQDIHTFLSLEYDRNGGE